jgi:hypothetical protein
VTGTQSPLAVGLLLIHASCSPPCQTAAPSRCQPLEPASVTVGVHRRLRRSLEAQQALGMYTPAAFSGTRRAVLHRLNS